MTAHAHGRKSTPTHSHTRQCMTIHAQACPYMLTHAHKCPHTLTHAHTHTHTPTHTYTRPKPSSKKNLRRYKALLTNLCGGFSDNFVDIFYGFICFALYAVQSSSTQYKSLLRFLGVWGGGGGVEASLWTACRCEKPNYMFQLFHKYVRLFLVYVFIFSQVCQFAYFTRH
jgi:hypothetical protein